MRGKSYCVDSKLQDKAPHLLDIDGDVCHHMDNSVKPFSKPFITIQQTMCRNDY